MKGRQNSTAMAVSLIALEESKYSLRVVLLLHANGPTTFYDLVRRIPTSQGTIVRCLRVLESAGLITSRKEERGRHRRLYRLTDSGDFVANRPPTAWSEPVRNP